jgi:hypothetical protein
MAQQKVFFDYPLHSLHIWSKLYFSRAHFNRREFATPSNTVRISLIIGFGKGEEIGSVRAKLWLLRWVPQK